MIKLHKYKPLWGLADPSPYAIKAIVLFKMAGIEYEEAFVDWDVAPRHKMPYITTKNGEIIGDTSFIKKYLEREYNADFSGGYDAKILATGFMAEKMCENHLYWVEVSYRWGIEENFNKGPRHFFDDVPEAMREKIVSDMFENAKKARFAHGIGRFNYDEITEFGKQDIAALSDLMGDNNFILGNDICGYDAMVFAMLWGVSTDYFNSPLNDYVNSKANLKNYLKRMKQLYFPEFA